MRPVDLPSFMLRVEVRPLDQDAGYQYLTFKHLKNKEEAEAKLSEVDRYGVKEDFVITDYVIYELTPVKRPA